VCACVCVCVCACVCVCVCVCVCAGGAGQNLSVAQSVASHTDEGKESVWVPKPLPGI